MLCGIDPGRHKIGVAFADDERLLFSAIVPKPCERILCTALKEGELRLLAEWRREGRLSAIEGGQIEKIYLGDGTSSKELQRGLEGLDVELSDEYGTTLDGRQLYWKLHPPKGLLRLIPLSLRTPPRDIDDLAAFCIIKR